MDLVLMRTLQAVGEFGSMTEAARALRVSQPALSRRVAQLEEELGAQLLDRAGRGVAFTAIGRVVLEQARSLVQRYDRLVQEVKDHQALRSGLVRLGGGATAVGFLLPRAIAEYRRHHPGVVFQVREAGSRDVEHAVQGEELELGIVTLPVLSLELRAVPLVADRILLVASRHHPLSHRSRIDVSDLRGETVIGFESGTKLRALIDRGLAERGVEVNVAMELRSVAAILRMVESTRSLAFVSELSVSPRSHKRRGPVVSVPVDGLELVRELVLVSRADRSLSPAADAFAGALLAQFSAANGGHALGRQASLQGPVRSASRE